jgi:predicted dienelactone hydrolase
MDHHDQYDSKTSQSKGITPTELRTYRDELHKFLDTNISPWLDSLFTRKKSKVTHNRRVVRRLRSLELYDRRIAIYRAAKELLGKIGQSASVEIADAVAFAKASDEALFLFDDNIDAYLADIYRKAMKLASLKHILDLLPVGEQRNRVVNEQMEIVVWCTNQFDVLRNMLKPFLRVNA